MFVTILGEAIYAYLDYNIVDFRKLTGIHSLIKDISG
jgi:hypothetical protein